MSEKNGAGTSGKTPATLTLADARDRTPAPAGLGTWAAKMRAAAQAAVSETDVGEILGKQVEKAKAGDANAAKFVLGFVAGAEPPVEKVKIVEKIRVVRRGKAPRADPGTTVRVESSEPLPPVAIDSPALRQQRLLVGLYLAQNHNARLAEMERVLGIPGEQLRAVLNCDWFNEKAGVWGLTPAGNQNVR
jgi:hypothetical protein